MPSSQTFCDGRLVEETSRVNVGGAETNFRDHYIPGRSRWLLDGEEITPMQAEEFRSMWEAEQHPENSQ